MWGFITPCRPHQPPGKQKLMPCSGTSDVGSPCSGRCCPAASPSCVINEYGPVRIDNYGYACCACPTLKTWPNPGPDPDPAPCPLSCIAATTRELAPLAQKPHPDLKHQPGASCRLPSRPGKTLTLMSPEISSCTLGIVVCGKGDAVAGLLDCAFAASSRDGMAIASDRLPASAPAHL